MNDEPIATAVINLLKQSIRRIYIILIITIILFVISIVDSFYQRYKIDKILNEYNLYEETEIIQDGDGINNYIGNNGYINYGTKNKN